MIKSCEIFNLDDPFPVILTPKKKNGYSYWIKDKGDKNRLQHVQLSVKLIIFK